MKAFLIEKHGKQSPVLFKDVPDPVMKENDVMVQIHAAGVNLLDVKVKDGEFKPILPYRLPLILGNDVAGVVTKVGPRVRGFKVGDEVYARPDKDRIGTFAEFIAMNERDVALKPAALSMDEAASVPLVALSAWQALVEIGRVKRGDKVFIQAGSGGVGTIAIQLAKHLGATVATTASTGSFPLLKDLGADVLIDYKTEDFEQKLSGYDLVLHSQGSKELEKSMRVLKRGGKLVSISGPPTPSFAEQAGLPLPIRLVLRLLSGGARRQARNLGVEYTFLFMRAEGKQLEQITRLIDAGTLKATVDKVFPFNETPQALNYVAGAAPKVRSSFMSGTERRPTEQQAFGIREAEPGGCMPGKSTLTLDRSPPKGRTKIRGLPSPDAAGRGNQMGDKRLGQIRPLMCTAPAPRNLAASPPPEQHDSQTEASRTGVNDLTPDAYRGIFKKSRRPSGRLFH